jgi:hypothetical protein
MRRWKYDSVKMQCGHGLYMSLVCGLAVFRARIGATPISLHARVSIYRNVRYTTTLTLGISLARFRRSALAIDDRP